MNGRGADDRPQPPEAGGRAAAAGDRHGFPGRAGRRILSAGARLPRGLWLILVLIASTLAFQMLHVHTGFYVIGETNQLPTVAEAFTFWSGKQAAPLVSQTVSPGSFRLAPRERAEFRLTPPPAGSRLELAGRLRARALEPGERPWESGRLLLLALDGRGKRIPGPHVACALRGHTPWTDCAAVLEVPPGAASLVVRLMHGGRSGVLEFRLPTLRPAARRFEYEPLRQVLWWSWFGAALGGLLAWKPWRQPYGGAVLVLGTAILVGVLAPEDWLLRALSGGLESAAQTGEKVRAWMVDPAPSPRERGGAQPAPSRPEAPGSRTHALKKAGHVLLFALFAIALVKHFKGRHPAPAPASVVPAGLTALAYAAVTEILQILTPDRGPALGDFLLDLPGVLAGLAAIGVWPAVRHRGRPAAAREVSAAGDGQHPHSAQAPPGGRSC